jgi:streptogramin lyase
MKKHCSLVVRMTGTAALLAVLSACGGGGSASVAPAATAPASGSGTTSKAQTVPVTFSITVPRAGAAHTRSAQYISTNTATASIQVNGGGPQTGSCTTGTCVVTVDAPIGLDTFVVLLRDAGLHVLSQGTASQTINPTVANTVTLAFGGVPSTVTLASSAANFVPGSLSSSSTISITVKDASNATIVGSDAFVDASGNANPITLTNSSPAHGSLSLTSVTTPATASVTYTFDGSYLAQNTNLVVSASATAVTPTPASIHVYADNTILEYPILTSSAFPNAVANGPDGNLWFTEQNGHHVGYVTPSGSVTEFPVSGGPVMTGIVSGPDGNLWFTDEGSSRIGRITPTGTVTMFSSGITSNSNPFGITVAFNGDMVFGEFGGSGNPGRIGEITTGGTITESVPVSGTPQIQGVALGSDHRIWFTEPFLGTHQIGAITIPGFVVTLYNEPVSAELRGITNGPDNNTWFTDDVNNTIGSIHTDGTGLVTYPIPSLSAFPNDIVNGGDGNIYFVEGAGKIARSTTLGVINEYTVPSGGAIPSGLAVGPDGNLWFAEPGTNKIGRFVR